MKKIKVQGYLSSSPETFVELGQVAIFVDQSTARELGEFLIWCAKSMDSNQEWDHEHFSPGEECDLQILSYRILKVKEDND